MVTRSGKSYGSAVQYVRRQAARRPGMRFSRPSMSSLMSAASGIAGAAGSYFGGKKSITSSAPITTQHDVSNRYRRKPMPRYRRKKWKKFTNQVKHVMMQMNALSTYTIDFINNETWAVDKQVIFGFMLGGTQATNNDELFQIFRQAYSSAITTSTVDDYKLFVKSLCLDVQLTNTGTAGCIVDVYTVIARSSDTVAETIGTQYLRLYAEQNSGAGGVGTTVDANSPASTPFNNGPWLQKWKILSKKEISLGVGSVTTMQLRNAANRILQGKTIESNPSYIPGYTRAFLFQVRGVGTSVPNLAAGQITASRQFTVSYGIPPSGRNAAADA